MSGHDPNKPPVDTAEIDEAWSDEEPPEPAPPAKKRRRSVKPLPPLAAPSTPVTLEEDQIEFDGDSVVRDTLPTLRHPNPLVFDRPESADPPPLAAKKPPEPRDR